MNNSDMPAMPHTTWDNEVDKVVEQGNGLTKREYFAGLAMQASVQRGFWGESNSDKAREAISAADSLLAELEKTK